MNKKAQTNKIFVYVMSLIVIGFIGFLVTKFVIGITEEVETRIDSKIYEDLEFDYKEVYNTWGSEEVKNYKVPSKIRLACFVYNTSKCSIDSTQINYDIENFNISVESGDNIVFFDDDGIADTHKIDRFFIKNDCLCIKPIQSRFSLIFQNRKNNVWILENN